MKIRLIVISMLAVIISLCCINPVQSGNTIYDTHSDVVISSFSWTLIHGITYGRKWSNIINTSTSDYEVRLSTFVRAVSHNTGQPVTQFGNYEDNYDVVISSWYGIACTTNTTATVNYSEKY